MISPYCTGNMVKIKPKTPVGTNHYVFQKNIKSKSFTSNSKVFQLFMVVSWPWVYDQDVYQRQPQCPCHPLCWLLSLGHCEFCPARQPDNTPVLAQVYFQQPLPENRAILHSCCWLSRVLCKLILSYTFLTCVSRMYTKFLQIRIFCTYLQRLNLSLDFVKWKWFIVTDRLDHSPISTRLFGDQSIANHSTNQINNL